MPPLNPAAMIAACLGMLVVVGYAVHEVLIFLPIWIVLPGVLLAIAAATFCSVHHLDNLSRQQPRYVVRDRQGAALRETNLRFVGWLCWFWSRSDGVTAHNRDGDKYPPDSWVQKGDKPGEQPLAGSVLGPARNVISMAGFRTGRKQPRNQ